MRKGQRFFLSALILALGAASITACTSNPDIAVSTPGGSVRSSGAPQERSIRRNYDDRRNWTTQDWDAYGRSMRGR